MDEILSKQVPSSPEAEQAVLGSVLIDPACIGDVLELISTSDFYYPENQEIFETIYSMFTVGKKIDAVTILDELQQKSEKTRAESKKYFVQLMDVTPTSANVKEYCSIIRDKKMLRDVLSACQEVIGVIQDGGGESSDIAELAEQKIYSIRNGREIKGLVHIKSAIKEVYDRLEEIESNSGGIPGITTGIAELDSFIGGLNRSDLILVAARPGMGKTSIALNIARSAAKLTKKAAAIFELEMSREQVASRLISGEAYLDAKKLRMGELSTEDWVQVAKASNALASYGLYIDDNSSITVGEIKAKCRRLGSNLGLIVIDYLQLMQSGRKTENRVSEVSEISRSLKIMAKELNVPVLCLSQLSRGPEQRVDKRPMLSDLRESGAIEQDADVVIFLYRDDYYDSASEDKNIAECIVAKNRHGSTGTVKLQWIGEYTTFSSQDRIHNE